MRLDGFGLLVEDMGKMIRFYRDVLGFEIKEEENTSNVYLVKDGTLFLLYGRKDTVKLTELFPDEIMLSQKYLSLPLQDYSVSPLTAFLLGWTDYIDTQLIQFTDTQRGIK